MMMDDEERLKMVRFIRQEAEEKANKTSVAAEEEFNIEKLQLVEADKKKIKQEYERKDKQVQARRKMCVRFVAQYLNCSIWCSADLLKDAAIAVVLEALIPKLICTVESMMS